MYIDTHVSDFHKSLETTLENLNEINQSISFVVISILIFCNVQVKSYSDMLFSLGCFPFITYPTRVTSNSTTLIDHIYTNNMPHQATSHILLDDISDHMPILMLLNNTKYKSKGSSIYIRETKSFNGENFLIELTKEYHNVRYEVNLSINDRFNRFIEIFSVTIGRHAPFKLASEKERSLRVRPWITKGILKSSRTKNKLYKLSLRSTDGNRQQYKNYCNKLAHIKKRSKHNNFKNKINETKHSTKVLWKTINDITKCKRRASSYIAEVCDKTDQKDLKLFKNGKHFQSIFFRNRPQIGFPNSFFVLH